MFAVCADPKSIEGLTWLSCYLTSGKHLDFYMSFVTVLALLLVTAPAAMLLGFGGAMAARSQFAPLRWIGKLYSAMVRGVPDIVYFMFFVIALDQGLELIKHKIVCPDWAEPIFRGLEFHVCPAAKIPLATASRMACSNTGSAVNTSRRCISVTLNGLREGAFVSSVSFNAAATADASPPSTTTSWPAKRDASSKR